MQLANLVPAASNSLAVLLAYFVLVFCIDIAWGVVRSMVALYRKDAAAAFQVKGFDWNYLANFAKSQLMTPPIAAVAGAIALAAIAPDADKQSLYAVASAAVFAQSIVLSRDIVNKIRQIASLITFLPATIPPPAK